MSILVSMQGIKPCPGLAACLRAHASVRMPTAFCGCCSLRSLVSTPRFPVCKGLASEQSHGSVGLRRFEQVLTELHFATTLRFTLEHASRDVPTFTRLVRDSGFVPFASRLSEGYPADRVLDPTLEQVSHPILNRCAPLPLCSRCTAAPRMHSVRIA